MVHSESHLKHGLYLEVLNSPRASPWLEGHQDMTTLSPRSVPASVQVCCYSGNPEDKGPLSSINCAVEILCVSAQGQCFCTSCLWPRRGCAQQSHWRGELRGHRHRLQRQNLFRPSNSTAARIAISEPCVAVAVQTSTLVIGYCGEKITLTS